MQAGDAEDAEAFYLRGRVYAAQKKWPESIADFTEAVRLDDDYSEAFTQRAAAYDATGKPNKAKADRDRAKKIEAE